MERLVEEEVEAFCRHMERTKEEAVDIGRHFNIAVLNSLWKLVLNEKLEYDDPKLVRLVHLLNKTFQESTGIVANVVMTTRPLFKLAERWDLLSRVVAIKNMRSFLKDAISDHERTFQEDSLRDFTDHYLKEIQSANSSSEESSFKGEDGRANLLNVLMDFFIAGSETTSATLNWAVLFMLVHPEVRAKVQEELDAVVGRGRLPALSDRSKTPYTEAVIHEVQRCGNILPIGLPHCAAIDAYLGGTHFVPKGTNLVMHIGRIMKDPLHFPEPEKFDPTRFLDSSSGKFIPHPMVIPFGVGRRRCLGETLARTSLYLFFTGILSRFDLRKPRSNDYLTTSPQLGGTLSPQPYRVRFVPRA